MIKIKKTHSFKAELVAIVTAMNPEWDRQTHPVNCDYTYYTCMVMSLMSPTNQLEHYIQFIVTGNQIHPVPHRS